MFCGYCGTKIPEDSNFCPNCGCKVEDNEAPVNTAAESNKDNSNANEPTVKSSATYNQPSNNNTGSSFLPLIMVLVGIAVVIGVIMMSSNGLGNSFSIEGKWKNVSNISYGQIQSGAIVVFDGQNCNVVSPSDTYAFYKEGQNYRLDCTTMLFSQTVSFNVDVKDRDNIVFYTGPGEIELTRIDN